MRDCLFFFGFLEKKKVCDLFRLAFYVFLETTCMDTETSWAAFYHNKMDGIITNYEEKRQRAKNKLPNGLKYLIDAFKIIPSPDVFQRSLWLLANNIAIIQCPCKNIVMFEDDYKESWWNNYFFRGFIFDDKECNVIWDPVQFYSNKCQGMKKKYQLFIPFSFVKKNFLEKCKKMCANPCALCKQDKKLILEWNEREAIMFN